MVKFFFRKQNPNFHSIENLFFSLQKHLKKHIDFENVFLPYHSGILGRIKNILFARKHKGEINHITGDIYYIALGLPAKNLILTIHDIGSLTNSQNSLKKKILNLLWFKIPLKKARKIVVISEFTKNELLQNFDIQSNKIEIIPDCVSDNFIFKTKEPNKEKPEILHIGTKSNKNLEGLINAVKGLDIRLLIVGKLTDRQKMLLKQNNIDYENYFNIPEEQIIALYHRSTLLFFASFYEGFGMPIIEAQATGTPVITSDLPPMKDVANGAAILVNPHNTAQIRQAIIKLLSDKDLYNSLIKKGIENARKYKPEIIARQYLNVYKSIANNELKKG